MATSKKPQAEQAPSNDQNEPQAAQAPAVDPGPPPHYPVPSFAAPLESVGALLFTLGRQAGKAVSTIREEVQAVSVLREPPHVHHYKAEVLAWLDAMERYAASKL